MIPHLILLGLEVGRVSPFVTPNREIVSFRASSIVVV